MIFTNLPKRKMLFIITIVALIQIVFLIYYLFTYKNGFFGDEMYSYATANSSETMSPIIDFDGTLHLNEWIPSEYLIKSVIVDKDEIFNYKHINDILRDDAHPPLYFYILHFFCSFFIGKFSWIPSIIINSISIFFMQFFFYRLVLLLSRDRYNSLIIMIFFGFTSAAINMMAFSRNYTIMTAFVVIFTYYLFHSMNQHSLGKKATRSIVFAAIFLYLAAMSQYLSIIFAFLLTLLVCIYYLFKKDILFMFKLGLCMIGSILAMLASFHYIIYQLKGEQTSMELASDYPFLFELRISIHILFEELFGIKTPVHSNMFSFWLFWSVIAILTVYLLLLFLFRSDQWFIIIRKKMHNFFLNLFSKIRQQQVFQYFALFTTTSFLVFIISYKFKIYYFYPNSDRYLFIVYPFVVILLLVPIFVLFRKRLIITSFIVTLLLLSLFLGSKPYTQHNKLSVSDVNEIMKGSDVIVFSQNFFSGANLGLLYLGSNDNVFFTTDALYEDNLYKFKEGLSEKKHLYMMYLWPAYTEKNVQEDLLKILKKFKQANITTINDTPKNFGAKLIDSFGSFVLIQLR